MKFSSILILCLGNICRSPYGEAKIRLMLEQKCNKPPIVTSAGITALVGQPADEYSILVAKERGLDISSHIAKQLTQQFVQQFELILVMDKEQKLIVEKKYPFARGKVHCIGAWRNEEIHDPYGKSYDAFLNMAIHIDACLENWIDKIL